MAEKEFYSIGEFSALFGINIQTLYYYDQIGILKPRSRNAQNGRRQYAFDQVYKLASIRFMRKLDYSIDQIKEFSTITDYKESLEQLRMHSVRMRQQWQNLLLIDTIIQRKIHFVERYMQELDVTSMTIQDLPVRRYFPLGGEEGVYYDDEFYYYPTIVFYRGDKKTFGAYLDEQFDDIVPSDLKTDSKQSQIIPEGKYICAYHVGPYTTIEETFDKIKKRYAHLRLSDEWITINIIDQFVENNPDNYITGIQIQILPT